MKRLFFLCLVVAVASVSADSVETTAEFALDNAFANMAIRSGETIPVIRDAAWAEGGVVFTMTGAAPEVLTEGARTTLTVPTVSHCKVLRLVLEMAGASYERIFLVCDGDPNVEAVATGEFALDSRTGEVRKAREVEPLRYSSFWSKGATRPEITVNGGGCHAARRGGGRLRLGRPPPVRGGGSARRHLRVGAFRRGGAPDGDFPRSPPELDPVAAVGGRVSPLGRRTGPHSRDARPASCLLCGEYGIMMPSLFDCAI